MMIALGIYTTSLDVRIYSVSLYLYAKFLSDKNNVWNSFKKQLIDDLIRVF